MSEILIDAFKHHLWANLALLDACEGLSDQVLDASAVGTYGSIRDTLAHLFAAEQRYLLHMAGRGQETGPLAEGSFPGVEELKNHAARNGEALIGRAGEADENRTIRGEVRGEKYAVPISVFFAQAINHATEHRAHVCTVLTQQGIEPPVLDLWTWLRSGMPRTSEGGR